MAFAVPFPIVIAGAALAGLWIGVPPPPITSAATAPIRLPWRAAILCLAALVAAGGDRGARDGAWASAGGSGAFLLEARGDHLRRGLCLARLSLRSGRDARLGERRADAGCPRFRGDHPRPDHPREPVRGISCGLAEAQQRMDGLAGRSDGLVDNLRAVLPLDFCRRAVLARVNANRALRSALAGISAAVVGIIARWREIRDPRAVSAGEVAGARADPDSSPAGAPDLKAMALAALAIGLSFGLHWPMLRMLGTVTLAGLALFFVA